MVHTHSSCRDLSIAGILVADGGLGFTSADAEKYFFCEIKLSLHSLACHTC